MSSDIECPNCGDLVDLMRGPDRTLDVESYGKLCVIGTKSERYPGYGMIHR